MFQLSQPLTVKAVRVDPATGSLTFDIVKERDTMGPEAKKKKKKKPPQPS
jgi:hypothetical protein